MTAREPKKILIVDDDEFVCDLYAGELQKAGFIVYTAGDGKTGLSKMAIAKPDLVLLDVAMPEMTGLEVLDKVKLNPSLSLIPVVLLTNVREDETIKQGLSKGARGYLLKTALTPSQVVSEVKTFLSPT